MVDLYSFHVGASQTDLVDLYFDWVGGLFEIYNFVDSIIIVDVRIFSTTIFHLFYFVYLFLNGCVIAGFAHVQVACGGTLMNGQRLIFFCRLCCAVARL